MPHTVQMATKKIVVKSGIQIILQSYEQAIGGLSPEQKQILGVSSEGHAREDILAVVQSKLFLYSISKGRFAGGFPANGSQ